MPLNALLVEEDWISVGCVINGEVLYRLVVGRDRVSVNARLGGEASSVTPDSVLFQRMCEDFIAYLSGKSCQFPDYPLSLQVSPTACRVLEVLRHIPYGSVRTYKWLAQKAGLNSPRAVGRIVGSNPIPIVIPCHRIIRSDGTLGGYSAGPGSLELKHRLLRLEGVSI